MKYYKTIEEAQADKEWTTLKIVFPQKWIFWERTEEERTWIIERKNSSYFRDGDPTGPTYLSNKDRGYNGYDIGKYLDPERVGDISPLITKFEADAIYTEDL